MAGIALLSARLNEEHLPEHPFLRPTRHGLGSARPLYSSGGPGSRRRTRNDGGGRSPGPAPVARVSRRIGFSRTLPGPDQGGRPLDSITLHGQHLPEHPFLRRTRHRLVSTRPLRLYAFNRLGRRGSLRKPPRSSEDDLMENSPVPVPSASIRVLTP